MKVQSFSASPQRRILIGLICNDSVCGRVASRWEAEGGLFDNDVGNALGKLAVDYFNRYGHAPLHHIETLASSWADGRDEDSVGKVEDFLRSLQGEYEKLAKGINADLVIDEAGDHFTKVKYQKLFDAGTGFLTSGQVKKAVELAEKFQPVEMGGGSYINPLDDDEAVRRVVEYKRESLIKYRGGLGRFFGHSLEREALVAVLASEKTGKSFVLLEFAYTAVMQGLKVAIFECGDLTQDQVMYRFLTRVADRPIGPYNGMPSMTYRVPTSLAVEEGKTVVDYDEMTIKNRLSTEKIIQLRDEFRDKYDARNLLRLSIHSASSISVPQIRSTLSRWKREDFDPDIVIVDYADLLAPPMKGAVDSRDQINATWKGLSKMRQDLHCCVITATQANADSYKSDLLTRSNFSEDKRKHAHVTAMFAINRTDSEKEKGIYRLNWLDRRDEAYSERRVCYCAGCLEIASPFMISHY